MCFLSLLLVHVQKLMGRKLWKQPQSNSRTPPLLALCWGSLHGRELSSRTSGHEISAYAEGQMGVRPSLFLMY